MINASDTRPPDQDTNDSNNIESSMS